MKPNPLFVGESDQSHEDVVVSYLNTLDDPDPESDGPLPGYSKGEHWGQWVINGKACWVTLVSVGPADWRFGTRLFLVINLTDESQEQPYRCVVGAEQRCSCTAGTKGVNRTSCKHRDCLSQLTASGVLPTRELAGA